MKKFIVCYLLVPLALFVVLNAVVIGIVTLSAPGIEETVLKNIITAQEKYPGKAEDALILFLQDTSNSFHDRSHVAVWTLGQIKSKKALPLIRNLYLDDPSGVTCKGRHDSVICQCTLHNAIVAIESDRKLHAELNK